LLATALQKKGKRAIELFDMLNPINHALSPESAALYKVEPYVVAADVYSQPPHTGRGGWTWYTGSAGWFYRVTLENLLGFQRQGNRLSLRPCISPDWPSFEIAYRYENTTYNIVVENPKKLEHGISRITLDGQEVLEDFIQLKDDRASHSVRIVLDNPPRIKG
jgi:cellobiose phosphorylase